MKDKMLSESEVLLRLQYLCSKSERCKKDIFDKLKSWKYEGNAEKIVEKLSQDGFIDETRYANAFAKDKMKLAVWGRNKIRYHLRSRNIDPKIIETVLNETNPDEYEQAIFKELERKNKTVHEANYYKRKQKLFSFAFQRGVETEIAARLIEKLIGTGE